MRTITAIFLSLALFVAPAVAQDWPAEARQAMENAGARLSAATTTAERAAALREIERIAAAHPDAPDARITASLLGQQATIEAGPAAMLEALGTLAASGEITDVQAYGDILAPLLETVGAMQEDGTLLPSAAIALDDAISNLNSAASKAGLPSVADAISEASGLEGLGGTATDILSKLAAAAKVARDAPNLAEMDAAATKDFLKTMVSIAPPIPAFGVNQLGYEMFIDTLAWNNEMYGESTKAMNLVANAIETGQFDHAAYQQISDNLNRLSKGPWDSNLAKGVLQNICEAIPVLGAWCGDAFKLAEELVAGTTDCSAITCDCQNVGGGLLSGPLIVQCEIHQADLISQCQADPTAPLSCLADAKGPGASH
ncbi:hypothetical protein EU803_12705 [Loktanella sp. IMCC34160]|uniref:hypothetical protein n=1 Tax=Loktanella sp. IMCC34160 TaxID=2510646 RepID=UPI00101C2B58|nr:hypothetical protein [Loktanella sp. IMCC34160]RYG90845.1 hypothetical protein EU803_12705 [Loktanella sp. IMCC34160]